MLSTTTFGTLTVETGQELSIKNCAHKNSVFPTREHFVCIKCGLVMETLLFHDDIFGKKNKSKAYQPIHYANERIAQWTGTGPVINDTFLMDRLKEEYDKSADPNKMFWGQNKFSKLIKNVDQIYAENFSAKKFHERWVWIRDQLGIETKPEYDEDLIAKLQLRYVVVHRAFLDFISRKRFFFQGYFKKRRSIISINYVFLNLLKQEDRPEFYKYFAEIKGFKSNQTEIMAYWLCIKQIIIRDYQSKCYANNTWHLLTWDKPDITLEEIEASRIYD